MKITMRDGRSFTGTPTQIVQSMKSIAFGVDDLSLSAYVDWVAGNALRGEEVELRVSGESDEERCASLVDEMVRAGLCQRG